MPVLRARTGVSASGVAVLAVLMVGLLIFHLPTEVAKSFRELFPQQVSTRFEVENLLSAGKVTALSDESSNASSWEPLVTRVFGMALIGLPIWYLLQRREREEELQRLDDGWAARLHARSEELLAVNNALVSEVSKRIDTEQSLEANRRDLRLLASQLLRLQEEERRRLHYDPVDRIT